MKKYFVPTQSLRLFVYVVGYQAKGESQVVILKDIVSDLIYYSAVIDCYSYKSINKTIEILSNFRVTCLDLFCWTHPDEDHSVDLHKILDGFCNTNTLIALPEGVYGEKDAAGNIVDFVKYTREANGFFNRITNNNQGKVYNVSSISVVKGGVNQIKRIGFKPTGTYFPIYFTITALAPSSPIIRRYIPKGITTKNDISIALIFQLGEIKVFLSGDIENSTIGQIDSENFAKLTYLKTPHHTSNTSDKLLKKFDEEFNGYKIPITCTTGYEKHGLPDEDLVYKYIDYTEVFCSTYDKNGKLDYGIVEVEFNPFTLTYSETLHGNAQMLFSH